MRAVPVSQHLHEPSNNHSFGRRVKKPPRAMRNYFRHPSLHRRLGSHLYGFPTHKATFRRSMSRQRGSASGPALSDGTQPRRTSLCVAVAAAHPALRSQLPAHEMERTGSICQTMRGQRGGAYGHSLQDASNLRRTCTFVAIAATHPYFAQLAVCSSSGAHGSVSSAHMPSAWRRVYLFLLN